MNKIILLFACLVCLVSCTKVHLADEQIDKLPQLFPDYQSITIPANIAPLNFRIEEKGEAFQVEIGKQGEKEAEIIIESSSPTIIIPQKQWEKLLQKNKGKKLFYRITILTNGKWKAYKTFENTVSSSSIDPYLVYRLIYPGYEIWNKMGIYQRNLTNYEETPIIKNTQFNKQCVNCHSFQGNSPQRMMMHFRGKSSGTLIFDNGKIEKVNPSPENYENGATYPAWHPQKPFIAYSSNNVQQTFHSYGKKPIEVFDSASDIFIYDTQNHTAFTSPLIYGKEYMETFPHWSPDGKTLYFCRAKAYQKDMALDSIRYDLCKVDIDVQTKKFTNFKILFEASAHKKSASFPRVSPQGKYILFTLSDYGNFSIWHPESDLYLLNLSSGKVRRVDELNSEEVDSYHTWSKKGDWVVFSSRRLDGLWTRPYFSSFNAQTGQFTKPFLLPQKDPYFYDTFLQSYNIPELIIAPVKENGLDKLSSETITTTDVSEE